MVLEMVVVLRMLVLVNIGRLLVKVKIIIIIVFIWMFGNWFLVWCVSCGRFIVRDLVREVNVEFSVELVEVIIIIFMKNSVVSFRDWFIVVGVLFMVLMLLIWVWIFIRLKINIVMKFSRLVIMKFFSMVFFLFIKFWLVSIGLWNG